MEENNQTTSIQVNTPVQQQNPTSAIKEQSAMPDSENSMSTSLPNQNETVVQSAQVASAIQPPSELNKDQQVPYQSDNIIDDTKPNVQPQKHKNAILIFGVIFFLLSLLITSYFLYLKDFVAKLLNL